MEDEVIHLQLLIDDLFTLARSEVGKLELRYESTDVVQLVREIVEKGAPLAWQSSRIEMVADTPSEIIDVLVDPNIWERFFQTERSQTRMDGGAGLGLALVKDWIEEMGGTVSVKSAVGEGSCFSLHLPLSIEFDGKTATNGSMLGHAESTLKFGDWST